MRLPVVCLVTPYSAAANNGNWHTAARWSRLLHDRCRIILQAGESVAPVDAGCLIALHARRSYPAVAAWREQFPTRPLIVVLTGTDLYRDLRDDAHAQASVRMADRLVVLQDDALRYLPRAVRTKARVVHQSARVLEAIRKTTSRLNCILVGHVRPEKDPCTALRAWKSVPPQLPIRLLHVGAALDAQLAREVQATAAGEPRYRWVGAMPHGWTRQAIKHAHLLLLPSRMEGGANVIVEAVTAGTPVLASRVSGNLGMLGRDYGGYFSVGDAPALARLLVRCWQEPTFYGCLARQCRARRALFTLDRERAALRRLLREVL